jgi:choloylglycine hydrolase
LESVKKIDDHPLYWMKYEGSYDAEAPYEPPTALPATKNWACSLFFAMGNEERPLFGRNFDWQPSPALVLFTDPADAFATISMVDISYLGFEREDRKFESVEGRENLLQAPMIPFDGMNEHGLVVGMAAVEGAEVPVDDSKSTTGSLRIIRLCLDRCRTVDEAIDVFQQYNIDFRGGPQIHYLVADAAGASALLEYTDDGLQILRGDNEDDWQAATNFYMNGNERRANKLCGRYAEIQRRLADRKGELAPDEAMELLRDVAQEHTRWSVVYDLRHAEASVVMSRKFKKPIRISLAENKAADAQ